MTNLIIVTSIILALLGVVTIIWSIIDTRQKYYNEYIKRKKND